MKQTLKQYMEQKKARKIMREARVPIRKRIYILMTEMKEAGIKFNWKEPKKLPVKQLSGYHGYLRQVAREALEL
jgi:hypothetical protein